MTIDLFIFHHNQQSNTTSFYHYPSPFHIYIQQCYMQIKDFMIAYIDELYTFYSY